MKFIVFETINLDNGKIYVGIHKVNDPEVFDGYLGDGVDIHLPESYNKSKTQLQSAVQRHGINAFKRITLKEFNNINSVLSYFCLSIIPFTSKSISLYHCYYTESNLHKKIRQSL